MYESSSNLPSLRASTEIISCVTGLKFNIIKIYSDRNIFKFETVPLQECKIGTV